MSFWFTCGGMLAVTFGSRLSGLTLRMRLPAFWLRFLHFVPIAVFAALVTPSLQGSRGEGGIRVAAAVLSGVVAWRTKQLALAIAAGMVAFWLLRLLPG
ncbi:MAG TPA: AzlD domain-containing protein [Gaiellaceae bacterium]|nr:AzlD domain-containing protein [Gaiellaceae bacterium]